SVIRLHQSPDTTYEILDSAQGNMTLSRRLSIFTFALLLLLTTVGAAAIGIIDCVRPAMAGYKVFADYGLDDALMLMSSLTCAAVVITVSLALLMRRAIAKRLQQFQLPPGADATVLSNSAGDELDYAAQRLTELTALVAQLRAKERSDDQVIAA